MQDEYASRPKDVPLDGRSILQTLGEQAKKKTTIKQRPVNYALEKATMKRIKLLQTSVPTVEECIKHDISGFFLTLVQENGNMDLICIALKKDGTETDNNLYTLNCEGQ